VQGDGLRDGRCSVEDQTFGSVKSVVFVGSADASGGCKQVEKLKGREEPEGEMAGVGGARFEQGRRWRVRSVHLVLIVSSGVGGWLGCILAVTRGRRLQIERKSLSGGASLERLWGKI